MVESVQFSDERFIMKIHNGVQLRDDEYEELLALAEAADNDEDVMLAAFMRLCPTGQEGAFDEAVVAAYAALAEAGFIEGVQEGGEFFFEDITPTGRALTNPAFASASNRAEDKDDALFNKPLEVEAEQAETDSELQSEHGETAFEPHEPESDGNFAGTAVHEESKPRESPLAGLISNPATTQAAIAGAVAGFITGAIAACVITIVL